MLSDDHPSFLPISAHKLGRLNFYSVLLGALLIPFSERQAPRGACREPNLAQYDLVTLVARMTILVSHEHACLCRSRSRVGGAKTGWCSMCEAFVLPAAATLCLSFVEGAMTG